MVMHMILLIVPFNIISHRPISSFIRGKILKKPPKQKWMLMTSEQPAEGKYENNTTRVVWYCCQNSKLRNIYMYTKTSNNPVKKITACPLAGESWWIVKIIWSTFQGKLKNNAVNSKTLKSELLGHKMHFLEFHSSGVCCWNNNAKTFNVVNNNLKIPTHSLMLFWPKDIIGYFR